jgi:hypothetical protein
LAATQNLTIHSDDCEYPLFVAKLWPFLDPLHRILSGTPKNRKHGNFTQ